MLMREAKQATFGKIHPQDGTLTMHAENYGKMGHHHPPSDSVNENEYAYVWDPPPPNQPEVTADFATGPGNMGCTATIGKRRKYSDPGLMAKGYEGGTLPAHLGQGVEGGYERRVMTKDKKGQQVPQYFELDARGMEGTKPGLLPL